MTGSPEPRGLFSLRMVFAVLTGVLFGGLAAVLLSSPRLPGSPAGGAAAALRSGIDNPVTAVLLAFRGYDTLLEIQVLLLAVFGVWSLGTRPEMKPLLPLNEILLTLVRTLVPLLVLTAGYLVWLGTKAPGGAFQAGALLAGAGVLLALADRQPMEANSSWLLRTGLALGPAVFLAVGLGGVATGMPFLHYSAWWAPGLLLMIEVGAAVSIGLALTALFAGGRPRVDEERNEAPGFRER